MKPRKFAVGIPVRSLDYFERVMAGFGLLAGTSPWWFMCKFGATFRPKHYTILIHMQYQALRSAIHAGRIYTAVLADGANGGANVCDA